MEKRMLIAGGGTGGHLFPGMAVAEEFSGRAPDNRVLFIGTTLGIEARAVPEAGYEFRAIRSRGIAGKGLLGKLKGAALIPISILDAGRVIRSFKPHAALGVGGYVSGPAIAAATLMGVPSAIQEQNAVPGFTNRILGRMVRLVFVSFEQTSEWFRSRKADGSVIVTGNPVRKKIVEAIENGRRSGPENGRLRLLVVGGSLGAHGLNELVVRSVRALPDERRARLVIRHQTGRMDLDKVDAAYREMGVTAETLPFINDMAAAYREADLAISRSGAGAVAEIALAGLPSLLVPYPYAASDHQAHNAKLLTEAGAAMMMRESEADPAGVAGLISELMDDPERRNDMADRARKAARPDAAAVIVDNCMRMMT